MSVSLVPPKSENPNGGYHTGGGRQDACRVKSVNPSFNPRQLGMIIKNRNDEAVDKVENATENQEAAKDDVQSNRNLGPHYRIREMARANTTAEHTRCTASKTPFKRLKVAISPKREALRLRCQRGTHLSPHRTICVVKCNCGDKIDYAPLVVSSLLSRGITSPYSCPTARCWSKGLSLVTSSMERSS